jgi:2-oxoisovalerate dehydrogenase E1 component
MSQEELEADEANDPLLHSVRLLQEAGALSRKRRWRSTRRPAPG